MKHNRKAKGFLIVIAIIAMFFLVTAIVMWLWNGILPEVIGVKTITYWQAMGILILSKILFGGFKGKGKKDFMDWKHEQWKARMDNFSPEEKEKFKQKLKERFANSPWCRKD